MLTRKCAINQLLEEDDFNVRVTIYDHTRISIDPKKQLRAWKEVIKDSLGSGITNDQKLYSLKLQTVNAVLLNNIHISGFNIVDTIICFSRQPQPIRITIKTTNSIRTWIIA